MSEEDNVAVDENTEVTEDTNIPESGDQEETTVSVEEFEKQRKANLELSARIKNAEKELKTLRAQPPINNDPQLTDELKLIARGLSDEEIEQAKVVAKGKGIALTEAIKDPLFTIFQGDLKEKQRKEKAKLGASKGSGETQPEVSGLESGSSRDEHKKAFEKLVGKK